MSGNGTSPRHCSVQCRPIKTIRYRHHGRYFDPTVPTMPLASQCRRRAKKSTLRLPKFSILRMSPGVSGPVWRLPAGPAHSGPLQGHVAIHHGNGYLIHSYDLRPVGHRHFYEEFMKTDNRTPLNPIFLAHRFSRAPLSEDLPF